MCQAGISYPAPARRSGSSEDPDCGFPSPPERIPPSCCHLTPAPGTSHCCWWGQAGRAGSPILPAQTPAPAAQTCSCFSSCPRRAPSRGCSTCAESEREAAQSGGVGLGEHTATHTQSHRHSLGLWGYFCWSYLPHTQKQCSQINPHPPGSII